MSFNKDLAQEIILDHNKSPFHREVPQSYTHSAKGENKQRGDKIEVYLTIENDQIKRASFWGTGGAVFTASASIMAKTVTGKSIDEARASFKKFTSLFKAGDEECNEENFGEMFIFCGIKEFPARVKCSTLPWYTMIGAIDKKIETISTELFY